MSNIKIQSLTESQTNLLDVYKDKWVKIGLSTERVDFDLAKQTISKLYKQQGLDVPLDFQFTRSPIEASALLKNKYSIDSTVSNFCYGSQDASWLSFYDYFISEVGVTDCESVLPLIELAKNCGWWSAYDELVVIQDRPMSIVTESVSGSLVCSCDSGPAIEYLDGFKVWIIDGVRLSEQIVMNPETLSIKQIHDEQDQDKRSIMIERKGWDAYIKETNSECIDSRDNFIENTKEALYSSPQGKRFIASCPTARLFSMGVPDSIMTCQQAQEWLGSEQEEEETINIIART